MRTALLVLAAGVSVLFAGAARAETVDSTGVGGAAGTAGAPAPVIDALARGHGGADALRAFRGFRARGSIVTVEDGRGSDVEVSLLLDGSMRLETRLPERVETRILAGPLAWSGGAHQQKPAAREIKDAILIQYRMLAAPFDLVRADSTFRTEGTSPEGWTRLVRTWRSDLTMTYDVDDETGLLRRVSAKSGGEGAARTFITEMSDYRSVESETGAVLIPFRSRTQIGGHVVSETRWQRIEERSSFPSETFLPTGTTGDF